MDGNAVSIWLKDELRERVGRTFDPVHPGWTLKIVYCLDSFTAFLYFFLVFGSVLL